MMAGESGVRPPTGGRHTLGPLAGARLRAERERRGWTQAELAARAEVSRQLVGAVEAGRHLPRVDAALRLAAALGVDVGGLFQPEAERVCSVLEEPLRPGTPVRVGAVGDRLVCAPVPAPSDDSWPVADGLVGEDDVSLLPGVEPGAVAVGCDPALGLAGALTPRRGRARVVAVAASTAAAIEALAAGRAHAAIAHGPEHDLPRPPPGLPVRRWHVARWQVGLAVPAGTPESWAVRTRSGNIEVVQREAGAGSQAAFERAVHAVGGVLPPGPQARTHLEAARQGAARGLPAVTIEPAARALGLTFEPLEVHTAQLWAAEVWAEHPGVEALGELLSSAVFHARLGTIGGYDLAGCGGRLG